jgi:hypothetical protein
MVGTKSGAAEGITASAGHYCIDERSGFSLEKKALEACVAILPI